MSSVEVRLLLPSAARCRDLAGAHQVADVLLQELVVAVELVVLLTNGLNAVEDGQERVLQSFGVPATVSQYKSLARVLTHVLSHLFPCLLTHLVDVFTCSARTHGSDIVRPEMRLYRTNSGTVARHDKRPTTFATRQSWTCRYRLVDGGLVAIGGRRRDGAIRSLRSWSSRPRRRTM